MRKNSSIFNSNGKLTADILLLNRAFFTAVLLFALSQIICLKISEVTLECSKQVVSYKRKWVESKKIRKQEGKELVFFFGDSLILTGIIPEVFDKKNSDSTYSYNLALPALPLAPHYFMLKDYLKSNVPPGYIIMTLNAGGFKNNLFPIYAVQGAEFFEILQYSFLRKDFSVLEKYFLPSKAYNREIGIYFGSKIFKALPVKIKEGILKEYINNLRKNESYPHDWEKVFNIQYIAPEKFKERMAAALADSRGYYYLSEQAIIGGRLPVDYKPAEGVSDMNAGNNRDNFKEENLYETFSAKEDPFIEKFFRLTSEYNIKVILIGGYNLGLSENVSYQQENDVLKLWKELRLRYKNICFADNGFLPKSYAPSFFSDPKHLNENGAVRYTAEVADEFKKIVADSRIR